MSCKRPGCGAETREQLCTVCLRDVATTLRDLPALVDELDATALRQTRGGSLARGRNAERPLPFASSPAIDSARQAVEVVVEWGEHISGRRTVGATLSGRVLWAAGWMLSDLGWFRIDEQAGQCAQAVEIATARILRAIDRPPVRVNAGPCGRMVEVEQYVECPTAGQRPEDATRILTKRRELCIEKLVGELGSDVFTCRGCGAEHTAADRKRALLVALEDAELPLAEILPVLPKLVGVEVNPATVRQWRKRGKLAPVGTTPRGVDLYRGGHILALVEAGSFSRVANEGLAR